jgi:hypothetical protein
MGVDADCPSVLTQRFSERDHALEAFVHSGDTYDPRDGADRGDAQFALRSAVAELHREELEVGADGEVAAPESLLRIVESTHGHPMKARAAANALAGVRRPPAAAAHSEDMFAGVAASPARPAAAPDRPATALPNLCAAPIPLPYGGHYWPRELFGRRDVDVLRTYRAAGIDHIRISGPPSAGKTSLPFAAFGDDILYVQGHPQLTVESLYGQWLPGEPGSSERWRHELGVLPRAMLEGKVLLIDEANRAPEDVHAALLSATDARRQIVLDSRPDLPPISAAPGFMVVITYNDVDHGTRPLPTALLRRFAVHIDVDTDYDILARDGVDTRFLLAAQNLKTRAVEEQGTHQSTTRWYPQAGAMLAAQRSLELLGARAGMAAFIAACPDRGYHPEIAQVLENVFDEHVPPRNQLGGSS